MNEDIAEILRIVAEKGEDGSFILSNENYASVGALATPTWTAGVVSPSYSVRLGEADPKIKAHGDTPEEAIRNLRDRICGVGGLSVSP